MSGGGRLQATDKGTYLSSLSNLPVARVRNVVLVVRVQRDVECFKRRRAQGEERGDALSIGVGGRDPKGAAGVEVALRVDKEKLMEREGVGL